MVTFSLISTPPVSRVALTFAPVLAVDHHAAFESTRVLPHGSSEAPVSRG